MAPVVAMTITWRRVDPVVKAALDCGLGGADLLKMDPRLGQMEACALLHRGCQRAPGEFCVNPAMENQVVAGA